VYGAARTDQGELYGDRVRLPRPADGREHCRAQAGFLVIPDRRGAGVARLGPAAPNHVLGRQHGELVQVEGFTTAPRSAVRRLPVFGAARGDLHQQRAEAGAALRFAQKCLRRRPHGVVGAEAGLQRRAHGLAVHDRLCATVAS
jgi:hypothetical protein